MPATQMELLGKSLERALLTRLLPPAPHCHLKFRTLHWTNVGIIVWWWRQGIPKQPQSKAECGQGGL